MVSMSLGGTLTAADVTKQVEQRLVAAVADSIGVPPSLVQIVSVHDGRRRLLAVTVTFRIIARERKCAAAEAGHGRRAGLCVRVHVRAYYVNMLLL
jgi:hypothetical protein